jgi:hypothetical protein
MRTRTLDIRVTVGADVPVHVGPKQYREELEVLLDAFNCEVCDCGDDVEKHVFAPDALGHPHQFCMHPDS